MLGIPAYVPQKEDAATSVAEIEFFAFWRVHARSKFGSVFIYICGGLFFICLLRTRACRTKFGICKPVAQRHDQRLGCWILTDAPIGTINQPQVFWHLDRYSSRVAAESAKTDRGVVRESLGRVWVATIEKKEWRGSGDGERIADIGPISVEPGKRYSAVFMEAVMKPGMKSAIHTHSGPEAWYTESGATCPETTQGKIVGKAGSTSTVVPLGLAMELTAIGDEERRGITLILHDASKPPTTMEHDWKPKGLCQK